MSLATNAEAARKLSGGLLLASLFLFVGVADAFAQHEPRVPGQMMIRLQADTSIDALSQDPSLAEFNLQPVENLVPLLNIWLVEFDEEGHLADGRSADAILSATRSSSIVHQAQYNHIVELRSANWEPLEGGPNDPSFPQMWNLHNTGQTGGTPGADVAALDAWSITTGGVTASGEHAVVAIVDNGFDLNHADVPYWKNENESPTPNGQDDDGNGYIDDYHGWNAYNNNGNITSAQHGTHVSGTAAARGNNALGVTGVNWDARIMPIQGSSGTESIVVAAYGYVLTMRTLYNTSNGEQGAFVVSTNASFGVNYGNPANFPIWCGMYDELGAQGIVSAGATMNINANVDNVGDVPTACPSDWFIGVTNTTNNDVKNSGAAYGVNTIHLGAPGTAILSTNPGGAYGTSTGTSMASPHVAGAVALVVSGMSYARLNEYKTNPGPVALEIKQSILDGTDDIGIQTITGGRLNLYGALLESFAYDPANIFLAADSTLTDAVLEGTYLVVPSGVSLTIENSLTLKADADGNPAFIIVSGRIQGEAELNLYDGSQIIIRPGGQNLLFPSLAPDAGLAGYFDGEARLTVGPNASLQVGEEMTTSMWVQPEGAGTLAELSSSSSMSFRLSLAENDDGFHLVYAHEDNDGNLVERAFPQYSFEAGETAHVSVTRGGSPAAVRVFVNAHRVGNPFLYTAGPSASENERLYIGNDGEGESGFVGAVDEFRLYNDRVSINQLRSVMHETLQPEDVPSTLMVYYRFDGEGGGAAFDYSGNNNLAGVDNGARIASPFPIGRYSIVLDGAPHSSGSVGQVGAVLSANVSSSLAGINHLSLYATVVSDAIYDDEDEELPEGIEHRSATVWGAYESGEVTASLTLDFSQAVQRGDESYRLLFREHAGEDWVDVTDSWTIGDDSFSIANTNTFGQWAIGYAFFVSGEGGATPVAANLAAAYPNPFTSSTTLTLELPEATDVTVEVLDLLGRRVALLHDGLLSADSHRLTLDGSTLAPGMYLVRASASDFSAVQRITLVR